MLSSSVDELATDKLVGKLIAAGCSGWQLGDQWRCT